MEPTGTVDRLAAVAHELAAWKRFARSPHNVGSLTLAFTSTVMAVPQLLRTKRCIVR